MSAVYQNLIKLTQLWIWLIKWDYYVIIQILYRSYSVYTLRGDTVTMTRKDFLITALGGFLGAFLFGSLSDCTSNSTTPEVPEDPNQNTFTSTSNSGHTHTVTITRTQVENPPAEGINLTTSSSGAHTHTFSMSQAQLQSVNNGDQVTITDSLSDGHTHEYTIQKWF